jgi:hypothetical protein
MEWKNENIIHAHRMYGIGERTAWSILAYIGDINFFSNAKQIASYAGLTPKIIQSGTSIDKSSLSNLSIRKIAKQLSISRNTVSKYLNMPETEMTEVLSDTDRTKKLDEYRSYIIQLLQSYPDLSA